MYKLAIFASGSGFYHYMLVDSVEQAEQIVDKIDKAFEADDDSTLSDDEKKFYSVWEGADLNLFDSNDKLSHEIDPDDDKKFILIQG